MTVQNFDYKQFAADMTSQAKELVPPELQEHEKNYIIKTLGEFTLLAGEALSKDTQLNLNDEDAVFVTQIIAEWSYHKSIDLIKSGILPQYWDDIMRKIAFTIFEVAKQAMIRKIPKEQMLQAIEHHVVKTYKAAIDELAQKSIIDENTKNKALSQSNIDAMAQQAQEQQRAEAQQNTEQAVQQAPDKKQEVSANNINNQQKQNVSTNVLPAITNKQAKLMTLAIVLKILSQDKVTTILNKFDPKESQQITQYMNIANLESQIDSDLISNCIKEIRSYLPIKRKLTAENILSDLLMIYKSNPREKIEQIIRNERPHIKRFISDSYDGELKHIPLKISGIVTEYIKDKL